jgi:hypothetical protein
MPGATRVATLRGSPWRNESRYCEGPETAEVANTRRVTGEDIFFEPG